MIHAAFLLPLLFISLNTLNAQSYQKQYDKCSELLKKPEDIDSVYLELVIKRDSCLIGSTAPDFNVTTVEGKKIELSKLKGNVVVLNFWYTQCVPCIEEMPELNKLVTLYSGNKVEFISFAPENALVLRKFLLSHQFSFEIVPEGEIVRNEKFGLSPVWPYFIIIDQVGKIKKMWFGAGVLDLGRTIDSLLN